MAFKPSDAEPVGLSPCMSYGLSGMCGPQCPALLGGDCDDEDMRAEAGMHSFARWLAPEALAARHEADNPSAP